MICSICKGPAVEIDFAPVLQKNGGIIQRLACQPCYEAALKALNKRSEQLSGASERKRQYQPVKRSRS